MSGPGPGLDSRAAMSLELESYFVSKNNGTPLTNGQVYFYEDDNRAVPKAVYELIQGSGSPPDYTYLALPNPMNLSATGTFVDANNNNIAVYYFPYDEFGNVQLYYIKVYDQYGNLQFTREAWPWPFVNEVTNSLSTGLSNQLTNPQFANVLFNPGSTMTIAYTAGTSSINIAPGWTLNMVAGGSGTLTVAQTPVAGISAFPFNPPYTLDIVPGVNLSSLTLSQQLSNNPDWAAPQVDGDMGYLSGSILLGPGTSVDMQYRPSSGSLARSILNKSNLTGAYAQFYGTIELTAPENTQTGAVGYINIVLSLSTVEPSSISNVQAIPLTEDVDAVQYDQTPVNRQKDYMFNYYNSLLQYKPIASYLCGWDFPSNPTQFLGPTIGAQATGANSSFYAWDQTIVYQSNDIGFSVSRGANGEFVLTSAVTGAQAALIQYLEGTQVREMLNSKISCGIESKTSITAGIPCTISLWYTAGTALPNVASGTNLSIVSTLTANGKPATFNNPTAGTWAEVPRLPVIGASISSQNATFTITKNLTTNFNFNGFSGWDMQGVTATGTAAYFAIVVGFGATTSGDTISVNSVSCVPGQIPTRPAFQSQNAVIADCQRYYSSSFNAGVVPATQTTLAAGYVVGFVFDTVSTIAAYISVYFQTSLRAIPVITTYNPVNNNALVYRISGVGSPGDSTSTAVYNTNQNEFLVIAPSGNAGRCAFNWTADARLGIV